MKANKKVIAKAKKLTAYIYTHTRLLEYKRKKTKGRELVRCGVTRFATSFLTIERLNDDRIRNALRRLFSSYVWLRSVWAKTNVRKNVSNIVFQVKF